MNQIKLSVWPKLGLADEFTNIHVERLNPGQCYTFMLTIVDEKSTLFKSCAHYIADSEGCIDLRRDAALHTDLGTYSGVFGSGLFTTLKPTVPYARLVRRDVTQPFKYLLSIWQTSSDVSDESLRRMTSMITSTISFEPHDKATVFDCVPEIRGVGLLTVQRVDRSFMSQGVQRVVVKEGRVRGILFIPSGPGPFPAILDLWGASGGVIEYRGALLSSHGIMTLSLPYFRYDDLPRSMNKLEIGYLEEAAEWLYKHPQTNTVSGGIGLLGSSKGGELGTAAACHSSRISALCTINGNITSVGTLLSHKASGTLYPPTPIDPTRAVLYDDETVNIRDTLAFPIQPKYMKLYKNFLKPFVGKGRSVAGKQIYFDDDGEGKKNVDEIKVESSKTEGDRNNVDENLENEIENVFDPFRFGKTAYATIQASMYPLEMISAKWCLFIAGEEDQNWPSPLYALEALRRLKNTRDHYVRVIIYPKAGHYIDAPCAPFEETGFHPLAQAAVVWGGESYYHQLAQVDSWMQIQSFFRQALQETSSNNPTASMSKL